MILDIIETGLKSLFRQHIRSFLTLLGVIIGIATIVCLLSMGQGLTMSVQEQFEKMGTNSVYVMGMNPMSQSSTSTELSEKDVEFIESINGVDYATPFYFTAATMQVSNEKITISVLSADPKKISFLEDSGQFEIKEGTTSQENDSAGIIISEKMAKDSFSKPLSLRKKVLINGLEFKIVGILKQSQQFVGDVNPENMVMMSPDGFDRLVENKSPLQIVVMTTSKEENDAVADEMTDYFEEKYGERAVYIYTSEQLLEQINQIYSLITVFLVGISIIALIVGGVGIMNAMVTSVIEKTKEIGIMKALGASNFIILSIFIVEAALIGLVGGAIGTIIGYGLSQIIAFAGTQSGFVIVGVVNLEITLIGLGFSTIVGMISGFLPARRAANMDPVEALRYE